MGYKWIYSTFARLTVLAAGVSLLTVGILKENWWVGIVGGILCVVMLFVSYWMQQQLREKSWLMLEAIRNRDYSFRLPLSGFSGGERVLQETLNQFGNLMGEQKQLMEQRERFYEQILSVVSSGIVVFDENQSIVQTNPAAARLLGLPILSTLRQLERYGSDIPQLLRMLKAGERCNLQYTTAKGEVQLSVHATEMQVGEETVRILTLNDIRNELDAKELDSWIKLTRVLTHEIMNSIAPISSLSETFLKRKDVIDSPIYEGIRAIHETLPEILCFAKAFARTFLFVGFALPDTRAKFDTCQHFTHFADRAFRIDVVCRSEPYPAGVDKYFEECGAIHWRGKRTYSCACL